MCPILEFKYKLLLAKYGTIFQMELYRALSLAQQDTWDLEPTESDHILSPTGSGPPSVGSRKVGPFSRLCVRLLSPGRAT